MRIFIAFSCGKLEVGLGAGIDSQYSTTFLSRSEQSRANEGALMQSRKQIDECANPPLIRLNDNVFSVVCAEFAYQRFSIFL